MSNDTYNGWTNYETWVWKLWMDNDYGTYHYWQEVTREFVEKGEGGTPAYDLSERLKEDMESYLETIDVLSLTTGPFADILGAGLSRINWYEIAEALLEDHEHED